MSGMLLVRNEPPVRGDVNFRDVGLEPGSDRGGKKPLRKEK